MIAGVQLCLTLVHRHQVHACPCHSQVHLLRVAVTDPEHLSSTVAWVYLGERLSFQKMAIPAGLPSATPADPDNVSERLSDSGRTALLVICRLGDHHLQEYINPCWHCPSSAEIVVVTTSPRVFLIIYLLVLPFCYGRTEYLNSLLELFCILVHHRLSSSKTA